MASSGSIRIAFAAGTDDTSSPGSSGTVSSVSPSTSAADDQEDGVRSSRMSDWAKRTRTSASVAPPSRTTPWSMPARASQAVFFSPRFGRCSTTPPLGAVAVDARMDSMVALSVQLGGVDDGPDSGLARLDRPARGRQADRRAHAGEPDGHGVIPRLLVLLGRHGDLRHGGDRDRRVHRRSGLPVAPDQA